jgi:type 1 glutamine amidotransferase
MTGRATVVVSGSDTRHDLLTASAVFRQLGAEAGFATRRATGTNRFVDPLPATASTDVFVLYRSGGEFQLPQRQALAQLVADGKGLLAVHASHVGSLVGGWGSGCPDPRRVTVSIVADHPITSGVESFEVTDSYGVVPGDVLAQAPDRTPVLTVRTVGKGRVAYLSLGHDMRSWGTPSVRTLVRQALRWVGGHGDR